ncbi:MAG TPA: STAS domain-containing protein [Actinomycetota bacterium]
MAQGGHEVGDRLEVRHVAVCDQDPQRRLLWWLHAATLPERADRAHPLTVPPPSRSVGGAGPQPTARHDRALTLGRRSVGDFRRPTERGGLVPDASPTAEPLGVRIQRRNGVVRVLLGGALDLAGARRLAEELESISSDGAEGVLFDARDVTFADRMGLRAMFDALLHLRSEGARTAVIGVTPAVRRLVDLTGSALDGAAGFELLRRFSSAEGG